MTRPPSLSGLVLGAALLLSPAAALATCSPDSVALRTPADAQTRFRVEVMDTDATRALGLMHRESLPGSAGMLFVYPQPTHAVFWMKNTLIPLDMIFLDRTGTVKHVHANAVPHDETGIDGGRDILAVLEINAGLARRLGIVPGSVMQHPAFDQDIAAWRCN